MSKTFITLLALVFISGCATVPMASKTESIKMKEFSQPAQDKAGLYIFREAGLGGALKKSIYVNGKCIGRSAPKVFFHTEVEGDKTHIIETQSEFSNNSIQLMVEAGKNYFVRQFIKMGVLVGGADLAIVPEKDGKTAVSKLELAVGGNCGN